MPLSVKNLGTGQVASSEGDLYACPASTSAVIKSIIFVNTNTTTETLNVYYKKFGGTSRLLTPKDFQLPTDYSLVFDEAITLSSGDAIRAATTTASKVDYNIFGMEIS